MSDAKQAVAKQGLGFLPLLTLLFIALKLCHQIDWSWWWVLSPILAPIAVAAVFLLFCVVFAGMVMILPRKR